MKKILYPVALLATMSLVIVSCSKEKNNSDDGLNRRTEGENQKIIEGLNKSATKVNENQYKTDAFLISAINGHKNEFSDEFELFDLLIDHVALSDQVLMNVINSKRFSNSDVELLMVLSSPINENVIKYAGIRRSSMPLDKVSQAQYIINRNQYAISGNAPYTVFFGDNLIYNGGELHGNQVSELKLNMYPDNDIIIRRRPCNDDNKKWMCGTSSKVELISSDGSTGHYTIDCTQSHDYCFKIPKGSRIK